MPALPPLIHDKSRMRRRACTDLCAGRSAMVVPTATIICGCPSGLLLHIARTHSTLPIPVQPRNSTVQCVFLAYFTPQMLPFAMVGRVPAQLSTPKLCKPFRIRFYAKRARKSFRFRFYEKHRGVGCCRRPRHSSRPLATSACPLVFMTLRIPLFAFPPISIYISMIFMHLQIPFPARALFSHPYKTPRVSPTNTFRIFRCSGTQTYQALCFHTVAHSLSSSKKSSALESATSGLFLQKHPGWGLRHRSKSACRKRNGQAYTENVDDDADDHHLEREGKLRGGGERHHDPVHKEIHGHAI